MVTRFLVIIAFFTSPFLLLAQSPQEKARELYEDAYTQYKLGAYERALASVTEAIRIDAFPEACYLQGLIYEAAGKDLRALAAYEATLKMDPEYDEALFQKALLCLRYGNREQAIADFDQLIGHADEVMTTRRVFFQIDLKGNQQNRILTIASLKAQMYHYRGRAYQKKKNYDAAMEDFDMAISLDSLPEYYISRALLRHTLKKPDLAREDLKRAIARDSLNHLAWYNLALIDESVRLPDHLMYNASFAPTMGLLASRALEAGRYREARTYFDRAIAIDPTDVLARINRGRVLLKLKQFVAAAEDFSKARSLEPARTETLYLIGNAYFYQKDYQQALGYYDQYLAIDPVNEMVWYNAAMSHLGLEQTAEACYYLERARKYGMNQAAGMMARYCGED